MTTMPRGGEHRAEVGHTTLSNSIPAIVTVTDAFWIMGMPSVETP